MQNTKNKGKIILRATYKKDHQRHNSQNDFYKKTEDRESGMLFSMC